MNILRYIAVIACVMTSAIAFGQTRTVEVLPDSIGALNFAILGDTTETGARVDSSTIYILKRNGVYKTVGEIRNPGFDLTIRAEEGAGSMPIIQPAVVTGGISVRPFTALGNLTLEGVYVTSIDDLGTYINRIVRAQADNIRITFRDCWFDGSGQSVVRFDNVGAKVYMENCIVSHIGRTFVPNNGRVIDFRTNADSLVLVNNTFFNITQRLMRVSAGRAVRYANISNNTIVNVAQLVADFEQCAESRFVDNLVVNGVFLGNSRGGEMLDLVPLTPANADLVDVDQDDQSAEVTNNWFHTTPGVLEVWADSISSVPLYDSVLVAFTGIDSLDLIAEPFTFMGPVQFKTPPPLPQNTIEGMIFDQLFADNLDNGSAPNWNFNTSPFFLVNDATIQFPWQFPFDFSYSPSSPAAIASSTGGPVGDPRWELEEFNVITGFDRVWEDHPVLLYPNPAKENFEVVLEGESVRHIEILDVRGLTIGSFEGDNLTGAIDISEFSNGLYFVRVTDVRGNTFTNRLIKR